MWGPNMVQIIPGPFLLQIFYKSFVQKNMYFIERMETVLIPQFNILNFGLLSVNLF